MQWRYKKKSINNQYYLAAFDHFRNGIGPTSKTFSAVAAKPSDGVLVFLHTSWDVLTFIPTKENVFCITFMFKRYPTVSEHSYQNMNAMRTNESNDQRSD